MAGPYYIYSGASGSGTGADWTNAFTSFRAMFDVGGTDLGPGTSGNLLASTDTIYVASDHADSGTYTANRVIYGPASGTGVKIISADRTSGTPPTTFTAGTTDQFYVSGSTYNIAFDGSFDVHGLVVRSGGGGVVFAADTDETQLFRNCTFKVGSGQKCDSDSSGNSSTVSFYACTFDYSADASPSTVAMIQPRGLVEILNGTIVQHSTNKRTGGVFGSGAFANLTVSGLDCSACGTSSKLFAGAADYQWAVVSNVKMATSMTFLGAAFTRPGKVMAVNCGTSDAPHSLFIATQYGTVEADTTIVRTGGASVEGTPVSWKMTGYTGTVEGTPIRTPWIYGKLATTGSKTFTVAAARDGSATPFYSSQLWLEVEVMATADGAKSTLSSDWRDGTGAAPANILSSGTSNQAADGTSSWSGLSGTNNLMSLAVSSVTVGEEGVFRARVCFAPAAATSVYIDPKVTVS